MGLVICKTKNQILTNFQIRMKVFCEEQKVSHEEEFDLKEFNGEMYLYADENGNYVSCARVLFEDGKAHLGRVATLKEYRNKGYAGKMITSIEKILQTMGIHEVYLGAQIRAKSFYEGLGYKAYGNEFFDAGIKHIAMKKYI